jgi:hypothetical protein
MVERTLEAARRWFFDPADVHPLALSRIGLGAILFTAYVLNLPYLEALFGAEGLGAYLGLDARLALSHPWALYGLTLACAAAFTAGLATPVSGLLLALCHADFMNGSRMWTWGWGPIILSFLVYTALGGSGRAYSVDAWLRRRWRGQAPAARVPGWAIRLIQVHIAAIYVAAAWHRIDNGPWWRGEMVFAALADSTFSRFPYLDLQPLKGVMEVACKAGWALELAAPLALWPRWTRIPCALGLIALHATLEATATVGWWQFMMMLMLFHFLPPTWSRRALEAPGRLAARQRLAIKRAAVHRPEPAARTQGAR